MKYFEKAFVWSVRVTPTWVNSSILNEGSAVCSISELFDVRLTQAGVVALSDMTMPSLHHKHVWIKNRKVTKIIKK